MRRLLFHFKRELGWSEIISSLALAVSITAPIVTYSYVEPKLEESKNKLEENRNKLEELKHRPQLITSELTKGKTSSWFSVKNIGPYPANNLQVIIISSAKNLDESNLGTHIQLSPPLESNNKLEGGGVIRLTLQRPLAPKTELNVWINEMPRAISLQNQSGDLLQVYTTPSGGGGSSW